jgi:hypothetical protein
VFTILLLMSKFVFYFKSELIFPSFCEDKDFILLVNNMLCKDLNKRLISIDKIKSSNWFKDFNWVRLY